MSDEVSELKISLIEVGHLHCTNRTATHLMKKLQLGLEELGHRYGRLLVTTDKGGYVGQKGRRIRAAKHESCDEVARVFGNLSVGNTDR